MKLGTGQILRKLNLFWPEISFDLKHLFWPEICFDLKSVLTWNLFWPKTCFNLKPVLTWNLFWPWNLFWAWCDQFRSESQCTDIQECVIKIIEIFTENSFRMDTGQLSFIILKRQETWQYKRWIYCKKLISMKIPRKCSIIRNYHELRYNRRRQFI